ncbi:MAG: sel1 repeat family protein [Hyphomicrobiaceae bacterium]|nr:sel1 repeat family protein [Hyphomicrobiaceae bacterium]
MARLDYGISEIAEIAAPASSADALFELGLMYSAGRDVECDLVQAHKWFNLAALRGNEAAKIHRMEIGRELSRADVSRAQKLAREWLRAN